MGERRLRLGILLDSYDVPAWAYHALMRLAGSGCAEFSLVILNAAQAPQRSRLAKLWAGRHELAYNVFDRIDRRLFVKTPDALAPKSLRALLVGVPAIQVKTTREGGSHYFAPTDAQRVKEYGLDVLIQMGFGPLQGAILAAARYGVWSYRHGDGKRYRGSPPGYWEVVEECPETGSTLCIQGHGLEKVAYRSWTPTFRFSPACNRNGNLWVASEFLPRQVERLYQLGAERFFAEIEALNHEFDYFCYRDRHIPTNGPALRLAARIWARVMGEVWDRACHRDQWYLAFDLSGSRSLAQFQEIVPPKDRAWADPHIVQADGKYYVFIEEYLFHTGRGRLAVLEIDSEGRRTDPVPILEKDYHLSYPFVFNWEGRYYMVPESAENRTIDLYECTRFPDQWVLKMTLMENILAVDATLLRYRGKWWLFAATAQNNGAFPPVELSLFHADELCTKDWAPHPLNPVISDAKSARPAGRIIARNGKLFRPSQDCSRTWGYGFNINEILALSETEYAERRVAHVQPHWSRRLQATHTFAQEGQLTMIDICRRRPR